MSELGLLPLNYRWHEHGFTVIHHNCTIQFSNQPPPLFPTTKRLNFCRIKVSCLRFRNGQASLIRLTVCGMKARMGTQHACGSSVSLFQVIMWKQMTSSSNTVASDGKSIYMGGTLENLPQVWCGGRMNTAVKLLLLHGRFSRHNQFYCNLKAACNVGQLQFLFRCIWILEGINCCSNTFVDVTSDRNVKGADILRISRLFF